MKLGVYYDEVDGELLPLCILLPIRQKEEYLTYNLIAPFEQIQQFYDTSTVVPVTINALSRGIFDDYDITVHVPTVLEEKNLVEPDDKLLDKANYFLLQMSDVEDILQLDIKKLFKGERKDESSYLPKSFY